MTDTSCSPRMAGLPLPPPRMFDKHLLDRYARNLVWREERSQFEEVVSHITFDGGWCAEDELRDQCDRAGIDHMRRDFESRIMVLTVEEYYEV